MDPLQPDDPMRLGDHDLLERLPEGPRGTAFLGRESEDAPLRVIKLFTGKPDPEGVARFARVRRLSSSSIARTVDVGLHEGHLYVVREHVEGRSLAELVAADGPLDAEAVERVAVGTLTALTAAHLAGITHRGLTPSNVIMGADGLRVTDLDLGEPAGEIGYRSPEQLRGEPYGSSADLFAWAATVVFAATGKAPFGQDADAVLTGVPALGTLAEPLLGVVSAALAKDAGQRPTTYTALLRLLGGPAAEPEVTAEPPPAEAVTRPPAFGLPALPPAADGAPLEGVPVQPPQQVWEQPKPQQAWEPPKPQQAWERPKPQQPMWESPQRPQVLQASVVEPSSPRRRFPVGLAASVAALMVLSGVGIWGASRYTDTQRINSIGVSADGKVTGGATGSADAGEKGTADSDDGAVAQPGEPGADQPQPEVTVPWATASEADPYGVGPLVLPTEEPSGVPTAPAYSMVPTPSPPPTQPVPTAQPTTPPPTKQPTAQPTTPQATPAQPKSPRVTKTVTATPTPKDTRPRNTRTPEQSQEPTPTPEKTTEPPTPTPKKSTEPPSPTPTPVKSTQQAPAPPPATEAPAPPPETKSAAPPPAQPQPEPKNPYTPVQVCGSGFYVQRSQAFNGGETFQLYNSGTKQNCVVTMKYAGVGRESPVSATLEVQGGGSATDSGNYKYYAGPVKLVAPGRCVKFSGSVDAGSTAAGWANCG
ncbi:serine/threonine protein kinase [Nonomuraea sp. NPDC003727]